MHYSNILYILIKFQYIYFFITQHLCRVRMHHAMKWATVKKTKLKKQKNRNKFSPLYPLSCRLSHRQISTHRLHIAVTTHNWGISSRSGGFIPGLCPMHYPSQTPTIHAYPAPFSLLAWHPNLFFLNSPSFYQSTSSSAYLLNDYQHTLLHRRKYITKYKRWEE